MRNLRDHGRISNTTSCNPWIKKIQGKSRNLGTVLVVMVVLLLVLEKGKAPP
jgi:hypothetical protein